MKSRRHRAIDKAKGRRNNNGVYKLSGSFKKKDKKDKNKYIKQLDRMFYKRSNIIFKGLTFEEICEEYCY